MLFRKDIEPRCEYCRHVTDLGGGELACVKRGITAHGEQCAKFRYDPIKREPEPIAKLDASAYNEEQFKL